MATITTRTSKGSALTVSELDANFTNINSDITIDNYPAYDQTLNLDFINQQQLDPRITFTRASAATRVNQLGILETLQADQPRFDFDPITGRQRGLLIEEQRQNLLLQSTTFTTTWVPTTAAVFTRNALALDGTFTATTIVEDISVSTRPTRQDVTSTGSSTHSFTVYAKPLGTGSQRYLGVRISNAASPGVNYFQAAFDVNNGTLSNTLFSIGDAAGASATITNAGNGWYRIVLVGVPSASATSIRVNFFIANATGIVAPSYTGDGVSGLILWGAQLEVGTFPSSYIPTTTATVTRAADAAAINTLDPWYNQLNGTVVCEVINGIQGSATATNQTVGLWNTQESGLGTFNGYGVNLAVNLNTSNVSIAGRARYVPSGKNNTIYFGPNVYLSQNTVYKTAFAWSESDIAGAASTGTISSTANTTAADMRKHNQLLIGSTNAGGSPPYQINGCMRRLAYYPRRLTNTELQNIVL